LDRAIKRCPFGGTTKRARPQGLALSGSINFYQLTLTTAGGFHEPFKTEGVRMEASQKCAKGVHLLLWLNISMHLWENQTNAIVALLKPN
jgi:hypothetical protein